MPNLPIGQSVYLVDADEAEQEFKIIQINSQCKSPQIILVPCKGGYSRSLSVDDFWKMCEKGLARPEPVPLSVIEQPTSDKKAA